MKAINENIRFLSKNYLNENCVFEAITEGLAITQDFKKLCDFNPYKEDNIITENTSLNFRIFFKDNYDEFVSREINTIILQNCNIRNMAIKAIISGNIEKTLYILENNDKTDIEIKLEETVNFNNIIFDITAVFGDETNVKIGQMRVCKFICDLKATTETEIQPIVSEGNIRTYDGTLTSWLNYEKWGASISARNINKEQFFLLKNEIKKETYITIIPWRSWNMKDVYEVGISLKSIGTYSVSRWSGLISCNFTVEAQENAGN